VWQDREPELVLLHGGSQNAHTWDTVAMALDRPLVAVDLPGHGHSDGPGDRPEGQLDVYGNAVDVAAAIRHLAPATKAVIGMSLGGLAAIALAAEAPELVRKIVLVDVLPGIKAQRAQHITDFVAGPASFASLDELLERTARFNPARSRSSLRRGILHNAEQQPDGTWVWRWARHRRSVPPAALASAAPVPAADVPGAPVPASPAADIRYRRLWEALSSITVPLLLARGMRPDSVLDDDDERELLRRLPSAQVIHVQEAGHSLQGDSPLELAAIIEHFVFGS
jgi:pimeloyl-ACP methyl ester carboxylesterase